MISMAKNERFQVVHQEGNALTSGIRQVLLDTATGVQYLFIQNGYAGGLCPLVDKEGGPLTWDV